jgi:hypothetical protein
MVLSGAPGTSLNASSPKRSKHENETFCKYLCIYKEFSVLLCFNPAISANQIPKTMNHDL